MKLLLTHITDVQKHGEYMYKNQESKLTGYLRCSTSLHDARVLRSMSLSEFGSKDNEKVLKGGTGRTMKDPVWFAA